MKSSSSNVRITPTNSEKFLSIKIDNILLLDSHQFLLGSLDSLVSTISDDESNFSLLYETFGTKAKYLKRKGILPYDNLTSYETLKETDLPPKEKFYNSLTDEHVTDLNFRYAKKLFKLFHMKSIWDYTLLYLRVDTILLASIFENFRKTSLQIYGLDPCYYMSIPGLSWDSALWFSKIELEYLN